MIIKYESFLTEALKNDILGNINNVYFYHGTKELIDSFNLNRFGTHDNGWLGRGVYFTNSLEYSSSYAGDDGFLIKAKLNISKPYILTDDSYSRSPNKLSSKLNVYNSSEVTKKLKEFNYDSVILTYIDEYDFDEGYDDDRRFYEICVFDPKNINIIDNDYKF